MSTADYEAALGAFCAQPAFTFCLPQDVPEIMRRYPCDPSGDCLTTGFMKAVDDASDPCMHKRLAGNLAAFGPTFAYVWNWRLNNCTPMDPYIPSAWHSAYHEADLNYIFDPFASCKRTPEGEGRP
jgi:hypothetical protein